MIDPIPAPLRAKLRKRGWVKIGEVAEVTGKSWGGIKQLIVAGDLVARNVAPPESRAQWRIFEEDLRQWFKSRAGHRPAPPPARQVGDFYDNDGVWQGPTD
jgi:hypothetical protein